MDHSHHIRLQEQELTPDTLTGATIYGPGDEKIGHVAHFHGNGREAQVIIDVGGFLGIGAKKVLLGEDAIHLITVGNDTFFATNYTKAELEALPDFDEKTVRK